MKWRVRPSTLSGTVAVPGDKSIGHRALMMASLASGSSRIRALPPGEDVRATAACLAELGVQIYVRNGTAQVLSGGSLRPPAAHLDARNSGTTMRLLAGILAGQRFESHLVGDASLCRRPMGRVVEPLALMGARVESHEGRPPLTIAGGDLRSIRYSLPVASAQVKSAILLAGLLAEGDTTITEPLPTRDHTERLFAALGAPVLRENGTVRVRGGWRPPAFELTVPGDMSSAAFLLTGAALTGGVVTALRVGVNPTRLGFLNALRRMGARVTVENERLEMGEPVADVTVSGPVSSPLAVDPADVPGLVDELPLVALLATQAAGVTEVRGAAELRVKETDRIRAVVEGLGAMGASIEERPDGFDVRGPTALRGATVRGFGDHRLCMMLAVAGATAAGETVIEGAEAAAVSFPGFVEAVQTLHVDIDVD